MLKEREDKFTVYGIDVDKTKMIDHHQDVERIPRGVETLHICLPCKTQKAFLDTVSGYIKRFTPNLVIIDSTVPPGTTLKVQERCRCLVAHSPVRGVHINPEHMKWEIKRWTKYVGGATAESSNATCKHFERLNLKVKRLKSCAETELAKLFETTYRAWMIACFQEMHRVSRAVNADFDDVAEFIEDTHRQRLDRPVMFPGVMGGHCLIPNAELLRNAYESEFLRLILESNEKRKKEMKEEAVQRESEKVRRRAQVLEKELIERLQKSSSST